MLGLTVDEVLTTTRAVRRRLDFDRPLDPQLIIDCLEVALQAPSGSNAQGWHWVVVTDSTKKLALAELYRTAWNAYRSAPYFVGKTYHGDDPAVQASFERTVASAQYLADNLQRSPALLIPCVAARNPETPDERPSWSGAAGTLGSVIQAAWSFMLAARERGLATCWTTLHLMHEEQAAQILDIPYGQYVQVALIPVAHSIGTNFQRSSRKPLQDVLHWECWNGSAPASEQ